VRRPGTTSTTFISGTGLKKWKPATPLGPGAGGGDLGHRQGGGVGGEDGVVADDLLEPGEQRALGGEILGNRLDHDLGGAEPVEAGQHLDARRGRRRLARSDLPLLGLARDHRRGEIAGLPGDLLPGVAEQDPQPARRRDLGDAPAHRAGADNADGCDVHRWKASPVR
jgi:hypothetical protein